jgi:hypothetical protein
VALVGVVRATGEYGMLPVLADALEDGGCDDCEVLEHFRQTETPHRAGCWALARFPGADAGGW